MEIYDCHVHTNFSHDGKATTEEQCEQAIGLGLSGITITDHTYPAPEGFAHGENIVLSVERAKHMQDKFGEQLKIFSGAEVADIFLDGCDNRPFYAISQIDCLLGSVHSAAVIKRHFPDEPWKTLVGCGADITLDFARRFTEKYFLEVLKMAQEAAVDVIAHLTYPLRYINGDGKKGLDITEFYPIMDQIFAVMIKRGLSLEVNTSGLARAWNEMMPNEDILARYFALGGRNVTTGSDAHRTEHLAVGIPEAICALKRVGFTHGSYYVGRKRQTYKL